MSFFHKLLIANRGEIACRVIRTARRLGIHTVAVYSDADVDARHVRLADEAVHIGPASPLESYLSVERIVAAAHRCGAQAIHPGYGFLSENADFAAACLAAGLVFVGPGPDAIRAMGSKSTSKSLVAAAGLPILPGYHGDEQDEGFLAAQATAIGFPVLIKAVAGGGGRGLRRVDQAEDFAAALAACRRESASSFGDDRVLLEKYLVRPRHIEVQIFADHHGHCVHLFERDCSVQRRHQKIIEEAPAPGLPEESRLRLTDAAIAAAQAVGYVGAGTVEFLMDRDGAFYFLEMNTRLQVEHPITEMITGLDLVEWQLLVAAGEPLPLSQAQLSRRGHAVEVRIYAEDVEKSFLPSCGRLASLNLPAETPALRVDAGVEAGDEITPHYDPLIAKLIAWGDDRPAALARLENALEEFQVAGVSTNIGFLMRLVTSPAFAAGEVDTSLMEREQDYLFPPPETPHPTVLLMAVVGELLAEAGAARRAAAAGTDPWSPWQDTDGWRLNLQAERSMVFYASDTRHEVAITCLGRNEWRLAAGGGASHARSLRDDGEHFAVELDGRRFSAVWVADGNRRTLFFAGLTWQLEREAPLPEPVDATAPAAGGLTAPMPGRIAAHLVHPGEKVEKGTPLLILEAMKMEHALKAPAAGTVKAFRHAVGDKVVEGASLVEFEPEK